MPRSARPAAVVHLTPEELAERLRVDETTLAGWRKKRVGPRFIRSDSAGTKATILYPLVEVEAWELSRLVDTASA